MPVPGRLDEITPDWLTGALRESGQLPRGSVGAVTVSTIGADRGFTGVVARVRPSYQDLDPDLPVPPASLVAKLPTAEPDTLSAYQSRNQQDAGAADRYYRRCAREVASYRELGPVLGDGGPRLSYTDLDEPGRRVVLLLEDLVGGRPGDALAGGTAAQAAAILDAVVPVHAAGWGRAPAGWVPSLAVDPPAGQRWYAERAERFLARHRHRVPAPVAGLVERLRGGYADVLAELAQAPATVVHSDLHLDNVIFDPPGRPVAVLDWQGVGYGPAVVDLADVLFASLPADHRRPAEQALLAGYAAALASHGITGYSTGALRRDLRLALLRMLALRVAWLATVDLDTMAAGRERALVEAAFGDGRLVAALRDHQLVPAG